ncbi:uncharacterized protein LODBEIA_P53520 [Lodderomyces beijingensis]|uniref:Major facilitator superfamily (MFS) profile domain-containing protein n=1 Tax=Lodderomyces beijingensis TaxID=1775926 RepID=A0ABP0ZSL3_9ASCO
MATRDLPHSFKGLFTDWATRIPSEVTILNRSSVDAQEQDHFPDVGAGSSSDEDETSHVETKVRVKNLWPAFASGAGLFSDGYVNNSISTVLFCLKKIYGKQFTESNAISNIASIAFVGTVVGQLTFGYISDRIARKGGMMAANVMLIVFTLLCAVGSWGKTVNGFFACLTVWRFFLGVAIGAEYPTASVIASEFANLLPSGHRNRYFAWFTNMMIDFGFVVSAFVPFVLIWIFGERHLRALWRVTIGLGVIPPLALLFIRMKMKDSKSFQKLHMKNVRYRDYPWWLIFKFYWFRLTVVSLIWFIYDFSVYSFGNFNTIIIDEIIPDAPIWKQWGWSVVFNLFYLPGSFLGAIVSDYIGPRLTLSIGLTCQAVIGIAMSACLASLRKHIAGFVVVFGIFSTLGEFSAGNTCGLLASKTSATAIRGQYYSVASAVGKIGAFVGSWVFPAIQRHYADPQHPDLELQVPFYISSALCLFSAGLALFFLPHVGQDAINREDTAFINYLRENGFDVSKLGDQKGKVEERFEEDTTDENAGGESSSVEKPEFYRDQSVVAKGH